ncbi:hypothetical protein LJC40_00880 [Synergistaceae bacterium OttesenSCG-928-D05]|nr:hypothetical protein [Synergistaceae bacterium OttesenSCG-928-D05]
MKRRGGFFTILLVIVVLALLAATAYFALAALADRSLTKAETLLAGEDYTQALATYRDAEKYNKYTMRPNAAILEGIAESYFGLQENESAVHYYSLIESEKKDSVKVQYNLGILFVRLREFEKAEDQVKKLTAIGTDEAYAQADQLSEALQKTKMKGLFQGLYDKITPHLPNLPSYLFGDLASPDVSPDIEEPTTLDGEEESMERTPD